MTSVERAIALTHIVARVQPTPGLRDDRRIVNGQMSHAAAIEALRDIAERGRR